MVSPFGNVTDHVPMASIVSGWLSVSQPPKAKTEDAEKFMPMQDQYVIGSVTIVQLVGLSVKPRIASARNDSAVRAADPSPLSAATGLGDMLPDPIHEIAPTLFDMKSTQSLGLAADVSTAHISFEAAVDRPAQNAESPDASNASEMPLYQFPVLPVATSDGANGRNSPPTVDESPGNVPGAEPVAGNSNQPVTETAITPSDASTTNAPSTTELVSTVNANANLNLASNAPTTGDPVENAAMTEGVKIIVDDKILDFAAYSESQALVSSDQQMLVADVGLLATFLEFQDSGIGGYGQYAIIDLAGMPSPEPKGHSYSEFVAPLHQLSATDALPVI